jgi:hypothetical protein
MQTLRLRVAPGSQCQPRRGAAAIRASPQAVVDAGVDRRQGNVYIVSQEEKDAFHRDG